MLRQLSSSLKETLENIRALGSMWTNNVKLNIITQINIAEEEISNVSKQKEASLILNLYWERTDTVFVEMYDSLLKEP